MGEDTKIKREIGIRIKRAREAAGLSQGELGKIVGVTQQQVSNWESGTHAPNSIHIEPLCKALRLSPTELAYITVTHYKGLSERQYKGLSERQFWLSGKSLELYTEIEGEGEGEEFKKYQSEFKNRSFKTKDFPSYDYDMNVLKEYELDPDLEAQIWREKFREDIEHWDLEYSGSYLEYIFALTDTYREYTIHTKWPDEIKVDFCDYVLGIAESRYVEIKRNGVPVSVLANRIADRLKAQYEDRPDFDALLSHLDADPSRIPAVLAYLEQQKAAPAEAAGEIITDPNEIRMHQKVRSDPRWLALWRVAEQLPEDISAEFLDRLVAVLLALLGSKPESTPEDQPDHPPVAE